MYDTEPSMRVVDVLYFEQLDSKVSQITKIELQANRDGSLQIANKLTFQLFLDDSNLSLYNFDFNTHHLYPGVTSQVSYMALSFEKRNSETISFYNVITAWNFETSDFSQQKLSNCFTSLGLLNY